jgi:hypothetical protein
MKDGDQVFPRDGEARGDGLEGGIGEAGPQLTRGPPSVSAIRSAVTMPPPAARGIWHTLYCQMAQAARARRGGRYCLGVSPSRVSRSSRTSFTASRHRLLSGAVS